ncbi:unnamed protein product [Medioppia subpectinata]|uniref:Ribosome-recycling factor, mitochondrial n=1 Tax=Medioppia subpectinata TaxID=1979941 RepID=A0A7R9KKE9_9ACAR|nr:unnamed protein product [Medioppia subpectinata]CAG2103958.1 unnamed protein product [Medioppia subpectinata]
MNYVRCGPLMNKCLTTVLRNHYKLVVQPKSRSLFTSDAKHLWSVCQRHDYLIERNNSWSHHLSIRCLSKTKDKLKDKKKGSKPKVVLNDEEMNELIPINELKIELNSVINRLRDDLIANVNIRSNPKSIDNVVLFLVSNSLMVDMNGVKHSLNEVVTINRKSPQLIVLNMASMPEAIKAVLKALNESGMNLSPQQEGNVIYVPIPKVTREHREGLADSARTLSQKAKDELKAILSSFTTYVKKQKKANVSEELIFDVNQNLKHLIDSKIQECDQILDQKLKELLK